MRILVAPMDWGLGHASRCVPLIRELLRQNDEVVLASAGPALALLRRYFPHLPAETLPAYDIRYPTGNMVWNLAVQAPGLARTVGAERRAVRRLVRQYGVQRIISDNRFGCHTRDTHNILMTHQVSIRTPRFVPAGPVNWLNRYFIERFDECWIPDMAGPQSLSGALSEGRLHIPVRHLGWLSSLQVLSVPVRYRCVAVLSGPEPQRSRLETILRPQLRALSEPCLLIRGKVEEGMPIEKEGALTVIPYLFGEALNETLAAAGLIIARSGYSTLMDLAVLGKKALLIPTPGQTEQIYLARRLAAQNRCLLQMQDRVDIDEALKKLKQVGRIFNPTP